MTKAKFSLKAFNIFPDECLSTVGWIPSDMCKVVIMKVLVSTILIVIHPHISHNGRFIWLSASWEEGHAHHINAQSNDRE